MSRRSKVTVGLTAGLAGAAIAVGGALSDAGSPPAHRAARFVGPTMPPRLRAAGFTLSDQAGRPVSLADGAGRVRVITFLFTRCQATCPVTVQTIRGALDDLGSSRREVEAIGISVDPRADTRAHVRRFLRVQHAGGFLHYLVGSRAKLLPVWRRYGIHPQTKDEDHTAFVLLVDRKGLLRIGFPSNEMTPEDLAHDLRLLLAEGSGPGG